MPVVGLAAGVWYVAPPSVSVTREKPADAVGEGIVEELRHSVDALRHVCDMRDEYLEFFPSPIHDAANAETHRTSAAMFLSRS